MNKNDFERDAVMNIQRYLRQLSFHDERLGGAGAVPLDGVWESETRDALMIFQESRGLPVTGTVDRTTWDALKAEYDESVAQNSPPVPLALFPRYPQGFVIRRGDRGYLVSTVKFLLRELERIYYFPLMPEEIGGVYDESTANTVKDFQSRNLIPPTGEVDRETWDALATQYNLLLEYDE